MKLFVFCPKCQKKFPFNISTTLWARKQELASVSLWTGCGRYFEMRTTDGAGGVGILSVIEVYGEGKLYDGVIKSNFSKYFQYMQWNIEYEKDFGFLQRECVLFLQDKPRR